IPSYGNIDLDCTIKDVTTKNGSWNLDLFHLWILEETIRRIVSIPALHPSVGPDKIDWLGTSRGTFSLNSAYWKLKESSWDPKDSNWNIPCKFHGPQRVRLFIWLMLKQILLTNMEQVRRNIGVDGSCAVCGVDLEDILHAIKDCNTWSSSEAFKISYNRAKQFASWNKNKSHKWRQANETIPWKDVWVQLNTDSAIKKDTKITTLGGVLWDQAGKWIMGFNRSLGECSIFEVEISGLFDGLIMLQN
ncbi:hypothetical protein Gorai_016970, partial [Gossypium raimondii]|nr:hypothetical protein [Gossypium raimondii]